ncbi:MAG: hypothetical protein N3A58_02775 [Spirochaetes bacterium]|nr:hypothetical protein [Spirochaetota bacterium]
MKKFCIPKINLNFKYILYFSYFIFILFFLFQIFVLNVLAQDSEYNEIYTLEDIIKKINELSKSKFSISFWTNIRFNYHNYNSNIYLPNNLFLYYYILNFKYQYYFSSFSTLYFDFNLSTEDNVIYLNNLSNNLVLNNIYINKLIYNLNISNLLNINLLKINLSFGQDLLYNSLIDTEFENGYYGMSNIFINKTFINLNLKFNLIDLNIYYLSTNSIFIYINLDLIDILKINASIVSPPIKNSPPKFDGLIYFQALALFKNFYIYGFAQLINYNNNNQNNSYVDFAVKSSYKFSFNIFNIKINSKLSLFFDSLNIYNPISFISDRLSNAIKLNLKNYRRFGGEISIEILNFLHIVLIPFYAFELDNQFNTIFVDFYSELKIYPFFISFSDLIPICNHNLYNGTYLRVGIKTTF